MATVFGAPRVPAAFVARPRVWRLFDTDAQLLIARAGAGAGKTIAAAGWSSARDAEGVWVDVVAGLATSAAFWAATIERLADAGLLDPAASSVVTAETLAGVPELRPVVVRTLLRLPREVLLVIDEAHLLEQQTVEDLVAILPRVPLRVIALGRPGSALDATQLGITLAPRVVTGDELAFDRDELAELLGSSADDAMLDAVLAATAGTPILTRAIAAAGVPTGLHGSELARELSATVTESIHSLRAASAAYAADPQFALRLSIADAVDGGLARELTGRPDAPALLRAEAEAGLGTWNLGTTDPEFRYSPAVLAALRDEAERTLRDELPRLHRLAATHALASARTFDALSQAIAAHDLQLASQVAVTDWFGLLRGHGTQVERLLARVSRHALRQAPVLEMLLALHYNAQSTRRMRAIELFALAALDSRRHPSADPAARALLAAIESASMRVLGRDERTKIAAERADAALAELGPEARARLGSNLIAMLNHLAISYFAVGDVPRALEHVELALAEDEPERRGHTLALAAGFQALLGNLPAARRYVAAAQIEPGIEGWHDSYTGAFYRIARAVLALEAEDLDEAQRELDALIPHLDTIEHWGVVAYLQAVIDVSAGHAVQGLTALVAHRRRGARATLTAGQQEWVDGAHVLLLLAAGYPAEALGIVGRGSRTGILPTLARARAQLALGHPQRAIDALRGYDDPEFATAHPRASIEALTLLVAANKRLGHDEAAFDGLHRAIGMMRASGVRYAAALVPSWRSDQLLAWVREHDRDELAMQIEQLGWPAAVLRAVNPMTALTDRETAVLSRLVAGATRAEIARSLFVSENTVKTQLRSLYRKLGVETREGAIRVARERRLLH
ncbi:hypothetical protein GCM10022286_17050 [Gryllotalpicola daejeonensis]|uniref:HTH luxR-type domain-containing protein n=1 Tax=Gryllotalpicola daejeonensis TaxID=993087 RepID=A0ABP7ZJT2_9MICO